VEVRINQGALARLLRARGGAAYRGLSRKTERVANIAEGLAPGHMGDYVDWRIDEGPRGLQGVITCNHPAVFYVLDGTRPHWIPRSTRNSKILRFESGGEVFFRRRVWHPGTRANPWLQTALRLGR
jgi:hypothetical protein